MRAAYGTNLPVQVKGGDVLPVGKVAGGAPLTVDLTVREHGCGRLACRGDRGATASRSEPTRNSCGRWIQMKRRQPVRVAFDPQWSIVWLGQAPVQRLTQPAGDLPAEGRRKRDPQRPARSRSRRRRARGSASRGVQRHLVPGAARPAGAGLAPARGSRSRPKRLGSDLLESGRGGARRATRPRVRPALPGAGGRPSMRALVFRPGGLGFPLGASVHVGLPRSVHVAGASQGDADEPAAMGGARAARRRGWSSCSPSRATCRSTGSPTPIRCRRDARQLAAARSPAPGQFTWRFRTRRPSCVALEARATGTRSSAAR